MVTVAMLKERLEQYPDDAEVLLLEQPSWPFEYTIEGTHFVQAGVCTRCGGAPDDKDHDENNEAEQVHQYEGLEPDRRSAVFLLEGNQERYGNRDGWSEGERFWSDR